MTSTHRLVDTSRNPLARELLRSAEFDEPPDHSVVRLALALGLGSSAVVSTIATGAGAASEVALGTAAAKGIGVVASGASASLSGGIGTGTAAVSGAVASNAAAGTFVASSVTGVATGGSALAAGAGMATAGAAPVVGGSLSAIGLLKAMAVVSLTCGALSFGGTKLAMTIAEPSTPASATSSSDTRSPGVKHKLAPRTKAATPPVDPGASPPPPPVTTDENNDGVTTLEQDSRPVDVSDTNLRRGASERNVGRQDIKPDLTGHIESNRGDPMQGSLAAAELTTAPAAVAPKQGAVGTFPSDDERPPVAANSPPEKKSKTHAKVPKLEPEADRELELVLLNRARSAMAGGQPLVALQALELYRTQAPHGALRAESVVLQVQALLALGQRSAAERIAVPLIKAAPQSAQAARLRGLLGVPNDNP